MSFRSVKACQAVEGACKQLAHTWDQAWQVLEPVVPRGLMGESQSPCRSWLNSSLHTTERGVGCSRQGPGLHINRAPRPKAEGIDSTMSQQRM